MSAPVRGEQVSGRPGDMAELWEHTKAVGFARAFSEFLDEFYLSPAQSALDVPAKDFDVPTRAFLAAVVETLALDWGFTTPDWVWSEVPPEPVCWEAHRGHIKVSAKLHRIIMGQTPTIFRQHGIYVRANILTRV